MKILKISLLAMAMAVVAALNFSKLHNVHSNGLSMNQMALNASASGEEGNGCDYVLECVWEIVDYKPDCDPQPDNCISLPGGGQSCTPVPDICVDLPVWELICDWEEYC